MSDPDQNNEPEIQKVPGIPMVDGKPFESSDSPDSELSGGVSENTLEKSSETRATDVSQDPELPNQPDEENLVSELPEASNRVSPSSAREKVVRALTNQKISALRVLADWNHITIELSGRSGLIDEVVQAATIPGVFSLEGANSGPVVVKVNFMPDHLGGVARTVIKLDRRLV